jgi:hypothetical protein
LDDSGGGLVERDLGVQILARSQLDSGTMNIDEKINALVALIGDAETHELAALALCKGTLREIQEELITLRREAAMRQAQTFSEREMAAWLGCNERQLRDYRLKHKDVVKPIMVTRRPRYSTWHQVNAQEIFTGLVVKRKKSKRSEARGQKSEVISDSRFKIPNAA